MIFELKNHSSIRSTRLLYRPPIVPKPEMTSNDPENIQATQPDNSENPVVGIFMIVSLFCLIGLALRLSFYGAPASPSGGHQQTENQQGESLSERNEQQQHRKKYIEQTLIRKKIVQAFNNDDSNKIPKESVECETEERIKSGESCRIGGNKSHLLFLETGENIDGYSRVCPICLCNYEEGDTMVLSRNQQCRHTFHESCVVPWLMKHSQCPYCRANYLPHPNPEKSQHKESPPPPPPDSAAVLNDIRQRTPSSNAAAPSSRSTNWGMSSRSSHDDSGYRSGDETENHCSTSDSGATRESLDNLENQVLAERMGEAKVD